MTDINSNWKMAKKLSSNKLSAAEAKELLKILRSRFEKNEHRHKGIEWSKVEARLIGSPEKLWSLEQMEITGGEPDVIASGSNTKEFIFYDCSEESPKGRRSVCYDHESRVSRKEHPPKN